MARPQLAAALLGAATVVALGVADGGVLPRAWRLGTIAFCAIAAAAILVRPRIVLGRLEWGALAALAGLCAWIALSGAWAGSWQGSVLQAERTATYLALVLAVLLVVERGAVPFLLGGTVAGITLVAGYALGEYLVSRPPLDPFEGGLLHRPLGYANALGIFVAVGALLALGLALCTRRPAARAAALAPLAVLLPALLLTSSRGAWLAAVAGLGALVLVGRRVPVAAAAGAAALAAAAVVAVSGGPGSAADLAGENRLAYWEVAWTETKAHPLLGGGAGTFGDWWLEHRDDESFTRTAHSVYVQALAELGPVGLALVVAALGLPLLRLRGRGDELAAAAAAGYVAYVVHTGVDWDWELPAATAAGLLAGGGLLAATRSTGGSPLGARARAALLVAVLALGIAAAVRLATGPRLPFAS